MVVIMLMVVLVLVVMMTLVTLAVAVFFLSASLVPSRATNSADYNHEHPVLMCHGS